jgi:hypothetical protein
LFYPTFSAGDQEYRERSVSDIRITTSTGKKAIPEETMVEEFRESFRADPDIGQKEGIG